MMLIFVFSIIIENSLPGVEQAWLKPARTAVATMAATDFMVAVWISWIGSELKMIECE